ncbi:hypothetical protein O6H91_15G050400 [Diphasiastrum complanatum]|uniref:Uncharacterized protein n=1 Tax=Diphasiastrum complanatum TaxID=34168 RepID=A0ACC2BI94_DIPCM|nr:hypothetical protein O6H91_15G050400 [Diphasiastrum complanatum]
MPWCTLGELYDIIDLALFKMAAEFKRRGSDSSDCSVHDSKRARDEKGGILSLGEIAEPDIKGGCVSELTKASAFEELQFPVENRLLVKEEEVKEVGHLNGPLSSVQAEEVGKRGVKGDQLNIIIEAEAAEDKGSRHTMEDAWVVLPDTSMGDSGKLRCSYFAIFDGHGGRNAAEYARTNLHSNVLSAGLPLESMDVKVAKRAILQDEALLRESATGGWQDGATAVSVWVLGQTVFVANIGDAKAVLARAPASNVSLEVVGQEKSGNQNGDTKMCSMEPLLKGVIVTREHKAIFPVERTRIQKAGGFVAENGRLLGRLEVSRAFGDRQFKKVGVSAIPDVHSFELTNRELFLILGCDGLWGVFGPTDAVEFVASQLKEGATVGVACRRLVREAVRERRCKDNCTAILVVFKHS